MLKQFKEALLVGVCLLLVTGCTTVSTPTAAPTTAAPATAAADTSTPIYVYVVVTATAEPATATPEVSNAPTAVPPTDIPMPTIVYPTATPGSFNDQGTPVSGSSSITITSVKDDTTGKAVVKWTATGTFAHGFLVLYSQSIPNPFYNGFPYYVVGSTDRSAYVDVKSGVTYYYRVCSYNGSGCDFYSNSFQYVAPGPTSTPK
jgi:hypothetical protein